MDVVIIEPKPDQHRIEAEGALEVGYDRDRGAGAHQDRFLAPFLRQGALGGGEWLHVPVERDRRRTGMVGEFGPAVCGKPRSDVIAKRFANLVGVLPLDQAERYFRGSLSRDYCLRPLPGVAADDTIDVACRSRRYLLDQQTVFLAGGDRQSDRLEERFRRQIELLPLCENIGRKVLHTVIETRDGDAAVLIKNAAEDPRQNPDRDLRAAAKNAGMQIAI